MNVTEKLEKLKEAEANYDRAKVSASMARSEEINALNKLNEAQRAFDAEVETIRGDSPGGDWSQRKRSSVRAAAAMSEGAG